MTRNEFYSRLAEGESFVDLYKEATGQDFSDAPKGTLVTGYKLDLPDGETLYGPNGDDLLQHVYTSGQNKTEEALRKALVTIAHDYLDRDLLEFAGKCIAASKGRVKEETIEVTDYSKLDDALQVKGKRGAKVSNGPKRMNKPLEESLAGNVVLAIADLGGSIEVADREGGGHVFSYTLTNKTYRDLLNVINRRRYALGYTEPLPSVSVPAMLAAVHSHKPELFGDPEALALWHAQVS